ncbi:hypothetical protein BT96DRAFT_1010867 [Gymnopus androsaceus JB14]|uniref:Uncharacterized protein n=1 Tax=Gymnopus androsaceus JB14 TaxID=1447944 RepID=A0A6A4GA38_9AGAR|nr:hypothetical protein BT96DRAFT_1010867 [Gymnopus androsaceus JB14]
MSFQQRTNIDFADVRRRLRSEYGPATQPQGLRIRDPSSSIPYHFSAEPASTFRGIQGLIALPRVAHSETSQ